MCAHVQSGPGGADPLPYHQSQVHLVMPPLGAQDRLQVDPPPKTNKKNKNKFACRYPPAVPRQARDPSSETLTPLGPRSLGGAVLGLCLGLRGSETV
eukprot:258751-Rhodomonas_salina.1